MKSLTRRAVGGALAGALATVGMSLFMLLARRLGWLTEQAPERITRRSIARATGRPPRGATLDALTGVAHLGFGAAAGALYALIFRRGRGPSVPVPVIGALYGTFIWLASYWAILPALGLMPMPPRDERQRPLVMLIAHWIFGGLLALITGSGGSRPSPARPVR
jgi:putative membrane protein